MTAWALQQTVHARLKDGIGAGVYDAVPRGAAFPYVVIGDGQEAAWDTATETGSEHTFVIRIWSRAGGHREVKQLAAAVRAALCAPLTLAGATLVDLAFLSAEYARDGDSFRATLRFRAVVEFP